MWHSHAIEVPKTGATGTRVNRTKTFAATNETQVPWRTLWRHSTFGDAPYAGAAVSRTALRYAYNWVNQEPAQIGNPDTWPLRLPQRLHRENTSRGRLFSPDRGTGLNPTTASRTGSGASAELIRRIRTHESPPGLPTIVWLGWDEGPAGLGERSCAGRIFAGAS